jgi:hypothetical protein
MGFDPMARLPDQPLGIAKRLAVRVPVVGVADAAAAPGWAAGLATQRSIEHDGARGKDAVNADGLLLTPAVGQVRCRLREKALR